MVRVEPIERSALPGFSFAGRRILVVDDEISVQRSLSRILIAEDAEVVTSGSLLDALELTRREPSFDAAVVDYWLVGERGPDLIAQMRALPRPCCALLITGTRSFDIGREAIAAGAEDFLLKPFTVQDFLDAVHRSVQRTDAWRDRLRAAGPILASPPVAEVLSDSAPDQKLLGPSPGLAVRLMSVEVLLGFADTMADALELTRHQGRILNRLVSGDAMDVIANDLGVTPRTVKYHACAIYKKVGVHSRVELQSVLFDRFGGR